jgi:hypothetical protein
MTIPNPVVVWDKWVTTFTDYVHHYRDDALSWIGLVDPAAMTWRRLTATYQYNASVDIKDDMVMTFDVVNITAGAVDPSWTTTDYTTVEAKFDTFFNAIASNQTSGARLKQYAWYVQSFNPYSNSKPFAPHGAPERVTAKSIACTGSSIQMAPQAAITITWRTEFPRNWGRNYIPALQAADALTGVPVIGTTQVDAIATAASTLNSSLHSSDFQLVVPVTSLGVGRRGEAGVGTPNRRLTSITRIQVDNVFDVIRRRRTHTTTYKKLLP